MCPLVNSAMSITAYTDFMLFEKTITSRLACGVLKIP
jgi:hypothetical protein